MMGKWQTKRMKLNDIIPSFVGHYLYTQTVQPRILPYYK